jgi:DNA polymerase-3 subunit epsilon
MPKQRQTSCFPTGSHYPGIAHLLANLPDPSLIFPRDSTWIDLPIALIDVETTGLSPTRDRVIELGLSVGRAGRRLYRQSWLVNPGIPIPAEASKIHGISERDIRVMPQFCDVAEEISDSIDGCLLAAYSAHFDKAFVLAELQRAGIDWPDRRVEWVDPLVYARELYADETSRKLGEMARVLGIGAEEAHRALDDSWVALQVLYALGKDPRVPTRYGAMIAEQKRLRTRQEERRAMWKRA